LCNIRKLDVHTSRVVITGGSTFGHMGPSEFGDHLGRAMAFSARRLERYLLSPMGLALPPGNLLNLFDSPADLQTQLASIAIFLNGNPTPPREKDGALPVRDVLFFFIGHGCLSEEDRGYVLVFPQTNPRNLRKSGLSTRELARLLWEEAPLARRYVFLDACYSETAVADFESFQSPNPQRVFDAQRRLDWRSENATRGSLLASSCRTKDMSVTFCDSAYTPFMGALLNALAFGSPSGHSGLNMADLGDIASRLGAKRAEDGMSFVITPTDENFGSMTKVELFPNPAVSDKHLSKILVGARDYQLLEQLDALADSDHRSVIHCAGSSDAIAAMDMPCRLALLVTSDIAVNPAPRQICLLDWMEFGGIKAPCALVVTDELHWELIERWSAKDYAFVEMVIDYVHLEACHSTISEWFTANATNSRVSYADRLIVR
jgi:hypothetical protein